MRPVSAMGSGSPSCRELRRRHPTRQLHQRQRVATRLVEDAGLDALVERTGDHRVEQQPGRRRSEAPGSRAAATRRARRRRRYPAPRRRSPPARPGGVGPRTRASPPIPGRAIAHRRRCTPAAVPPRSRRGASGPPTRPGTDPGAGPRSDRRGASASRCGSGSCPRRPSIGVHRECRPAKASSISDSTPVAQTIEHPSAAVGTWRRARSCRHRLHRGAPAPDSDRRERRLRAAPGRGVPRRGRAAPVPGGCAMPQRILREKVPLARARHRRAASRRRRARRRRRQPSSRPSSRAATATGSERPVPRSSNVISRPNAWRRSNARAKCGSSHINSTCVANSGMNNRSMGPSPETWKAT